MKDRHEKVRLNGETYWLHGDCLSPLDHYDETGELLANPFRDVSYAIVLEDGSIMRYRHKIGTLEDLERVTD
jgi:hypothetical protein